VERVRSVVTLQELTVKKPCAAGKAPPPHRGLCHFQLQFCFNATSTPSPPSFKSFFSRSGGLAPGPSICGATDPSILAALSCLAGCPWSCSWARAVTAPTGRRQLRGPAYHCAQAAFREFPPAPRTPSGQASDSLALLGISPGPPRQNHTVLSDAASWEAGNARQA